MGALQKEPHDKLAEEKPIAPSSRWPSHKYPCFKVRMKGSVSNFILRNDVPN